MRGSGFGALPFNMYQVQVYLPLLHQLPVRQQHGTGSAWKADARPSQLAVQGPLELFVADSIL
jgi:hypothetical protein